MGTVSALKHQDQDDPGLTLEDLFAESVTFTFDYRGKPLEVTWAPDRYTADIEERVQSILHGEDPEIDEGTSDDSAVLIRQAAKRRKDMAGTREMLASVLVDWSLKGRDGLPVAINEESLRKLPTAFLTAVFNALSENAGPKEVAEPDSEAT